MRILNIIILISAILFTGCVQKPNTFYFDNWEREYRYFSYAVQIISDPPGARIEWDNNYIGTTPLTYIVNGAPGLVVVKAYPMYPGQYMQTKFLHGIDPLPRRIYFQMNLR